MVGELLDEPPAAPRKSDRRGRHSGGGLNIVFVQAVNVGEYGPVQVAARTERFE